MMLMWFLSPRSCAFLALLPFVLVRCARFRDGSGIIVWGLKQPLVNDVICHDRFTDRHRTHQSTKGRERSAPGMSHADTHTPLHGPTGGVPSDKALSDKEDIPDFLQKLHEVDTSEVLGVGVARVRTSGPRMLAWITYGGPDGIGALNLGGGTLFSYFYSEVRTR
eukprot:scaffold2419_cov114-Isochrysis_galbana.AAC.13